MIKTINPMFTSPEIDAVEEAIRDVDRVIWSSEQFDKDTHDLFNELIIMRSEYVDALATKLGITSRQLVRKRLGIVDIFND